MRNYYLLFDDSKTAIALYSHLKEHNIKCTMAPTPRKADACCGVSILYYQSEDRKKIEELSEKTSIQINRFWECENEDDPTRHRFC